MRYIILTLLLMVISKQGEASEFKVEALLGYAHHYMPYKGYNDRTFKNNLTSDVGLLSVSYKSVSILGLSDSQGNLSFATTYNYKLIDDTEFKVKLIAGVYAMRSDSEPDVFSKELKAFLPTIGLGNREFSLIPLFGIQADINLIKNVDLTILTTPTFLLVGLKLSL